ncbi:MAG: hypothetical protein WCI40_05450 [Verrucomicrobiota bacterium]
MFGFFYEYIFNPSSEIVKQMMITTSKYYTSNIDYLKDTQSILKLKNKEDKLEEKDKTEEKGKKTENINLDQI